MELALFSLLFFAFGAICGVLAGFYIRGKQNTIKGLQSAVAAIHEAAKCQSSIIITIDATETEKGGITTQRQHFGVIAEESIDVQAELTEAYFALCPNLAELPEVKAILIANLDPESAALNYTRKEVADAITVMQASVYADRQAVIDALLETYTISA